MEFPNNLTVEEALVRMLELLAELEGRVAALEETERAS